MCHFSRSPLCVLAIQFEEGKQYRSLNCYRSALSATLLPIEGFPVGQHPLVLRHLRPPQPRYSDTWDVSRVLSHISSKWDDNKKLSLKQITKKVTILLALVLASISSDLVRLSLKGRRYTQEGVPLQCTGLAKQVRPSSLTAQEVFVTAFEDEALRPVACLRVYESLTSSVRNITFKYSFSAKTSYIIFYCLMDQGGHSER